MEELDFNEIKKAQKGDKKAFDSIITVYRQRIIDLCSRYMRRTDEALDMAQEVFCNAYGELKNFRYKSKFSTWLYRMTVNMCINRLKSLKRRRFFETGSLTADEENNEKQIDVADARMPADKEMEEKDTRNIVLAELESLEPDEKSVIILREIEQVEYSEIAEIMKMPLGSVKSKLTRAREKLKQRLIKKIGD